MFLKGGEVWNVNWSFHAVCVEVLSVRDETESLFLRGTQLISSYCCVGPATEKAPTKRVYGSQESDQVKDTVGPGEMPQVTQPGKGQYRLSTDSPFVLSVFASNFGLGLALSRPSCSPLNQEVMNGAFVMDQSVLQRSKQVICLVWNKDSVFTHQKGRNHVFLSLHWYYSTTSW